MAYLPSSGSIVAFQSDPTKLVGTVSVVGTLPVVLNNSSIISVQQGSIATVIIGGSIATSSPANQSVSGTVNVGNFPTNQNVSGSVVAFQGGTQISSISGVVDMSGSIKGTYANSNVASTVTGLAVMFKQNISSSIMTEISPTFPLPVYGSVSGSVGIVGTPSISGAVFISGSVLAQQTGTRITSVSGAVATTQSGTWISSMVNTVPSSVMVSASIFGQLPAGTAPLGSVAVLQGTNPFIIVGSVYGNISGSVLSNQAGGWRVSVQGAVSPTATISSMKAIASTTTLLASNTARRGATISNVSGTSILVALGNMATVNNNSFMMNNNDYYETPFNYSGVIQHFASSTAGFIQVTEIT